MAMLPNRHTMLSDYSELNIFTGPCVTGIDR